ncbi:DUF6316 family protein [Aliikangiella sp. IMCC44359]|uniref:DUF6316 family protein n=1 Tax=Aliikangiella sp. IMCC44359 TaxID=3459125 RepID=UPI00403B1BDF
MRKDDFSNKEYNRTERVYQEGAGWFFYIRQGAVFGPYESKQNAQKGVESFVTILKQQNAG